ncbi:MAG TPA: MFS transporter [Thermoanaerobaculia bacterium]|nr:MFS transporter [Thermoanaerobaculia bacterium]
MPKRILAAYRAAFSGLPRTVWLLSIASLVNRSGTMVLPFATLYFTGPKGWTATEAGLALSCYGFGALAGSFGGGWLCDRLDAIWILRGSLLFNGLGFFALEHLDRRAVVYPFLALLGAASESFRPANATAIATLAGPGQRMRAFALYRLAINLGMSIGPVLGGLLAEIDYRWLFRVDGTTSLAAASFLTFWVRGVGTTRAAGQAAAPGSGGGRSPWRDGPFFALLALTIPLASVFFQVQSTYPLALHLAYGFPEAQIGLILSVNTAIIVLCEMLLAHALRDAVPLKLVAWGSLLFGAGLALLPLGASALYVAATVVIWTFGEMLSIPFLQGVVAERALGGRRGTYLGLLNLCFSIAFVIGPATGAFVFERFGLAPLWLGCGVVCLFVCLGFHGLARAMRRPEPAS